MNRPALHLATESAAENGAPSTHAHADLSPVARIPTKGRAHDELLATMEAMRASDTDWLRGRCFSLVYHAGDAHSAFLKKAHNTFFSENGLNPMAFKSLKRMEGEVVRMAANLLHGDDKVVGTMTSGGTESLLLAVKTYRDWARKHRPWIKKPEIVLPTTAHVAFDKGGHYFGVRLRHAPVGDDFRVNVKAVKRLINKNTIAIAASAPQYPHGVVDPIAQLAAIALDKGIPMHVDACVGGFNLPFLEKLGVDVPLFDFRVPGVTSISADLHKYGYTAKGASVILYRSMDYLTHQFFVATEFPGGIYASPTIPGTRAGGSIAAAWAGLQAMGEEGYLALTRDALQACDRLKAGIAAIDGLRIIGSQATTIVCWTAAQKHGRDDVNVYAVADQMEDRGWLVDRQQNPPSVHLTVTSNHLAYVDQYVSDLSASVAFVKAHPEVQSRGNAAMYGMMAKVPMRGMVKGAVQKVMESMYGPDGKEPDLSAPPAGATVVDKLVNKVMSEHGDRALAVLDGIDRAKKRLQRLRDR